MYQTLFCPFSWYTTINKKYELLNKLQYNHEHFVKILNYLFDEYCIDVDELNNII